MGWNKREVSSGMRSIEKAKRGDILKLSEEGLNWLDWGIQDRREKLSNKRFEYRCICRADYNCITVKTDYGNGWYQTYHSTFLELDKITTGR